MHTGSDVAVLGLWHLGSVTAAGWTTLGRPVRAWDENPDLRESMANARTPVSEPGVAEALSAALDRGLLEVVDEPGRAIRGARVTHLVYDTRIGEDGLPADARLEEAVELFALDAPDGALLVVSSQIPVGTAARWRKRLEKADRGLLVAHVPENLRLGRSLDDFLHPQRLVIGADDEEAHALAADLFSVFETNIMHVGLTSAEMAKHATNAYLGFCIAFANDIAWLALEAGADPSEVLGALRADSRVAPTAPLRPGTAFSGATLVRDLTTLRQLGTRASRPHIFDAVIASNEVHSDVALAWLESELGSLDGRCIAVAGLTYKPGTSTLRDSLPLRIVGRLAEQGATVSVWDPLAETVDSTDFTRVATLSEATEGADALAVLTALPELASVDWTNLPSIGRIVVDTCNVVDREAAESAGWTYRGFSVSPKPWLDSTMYFGRPRTSL